MLAQDVLDQPIFSLKLPQYEPDEGELLFGATNHSLNSTDFVTVPVINQMSKSLFENSWTVNASHIPFDTPVPLEYALPQATFAAM